MRNSDPIREEHRHLLSGIEALRRAGDRIGEADEATSKREVDGCIDFLQGHLIPHARREEEVLYPLVARVMGSPAATVTMSIDHAEVGTLTAQLERAAEEGDDVMTRRLLYGLYHVVRLHFRKEEQAYLPLLDEGLTPEEAKELFDRLHVA